METRSDPVYPQAYPLSLSPKNNTHFIDCHIIKSNEFSAKRSSNLSTLITTTLSMLTSIHIDLKLQQENTL